jgi:hypothetical protein
LPLIAQASFLSYEHRLIWRQTVLFENLKAGLWPPAAVSCLFN